MIHAIIIILVLMLYLRDSGVTLAAEPLVSPTIATALTLGAFAFVIIQTHLVLALFARSINRRVSTKLLIWADRVLLGSRVLTLIVQAGAVFALAWLDLIRRQIGDLVFLDELVALTPALLTLAAGWIAYYPLERRLREMVQIRAVELGEHVYPVPTRTQFLMDNVRHHMLIILIPISLILAWAEALNFLFMELVERGLLASTSTQTESLYIAANLAGVLLVFIVTPGLIARVWSTVPLPAGELRDKLLALCAAQGVRCRKLLIWRTHGLMINGAVMGLLGRFRFILLTDALLDSLPTEQIEAVMAHEVGHVRRHHLPWLMLSLIAALSLAYFGVVALSDLAMSPTPGGTLSGLVDLSAFFSATIAALFIFGFISRLFERQADAFAAQHLSGMTRANHGRDLTVTPEGALAMIHALESVARLNRIPKRKFTWRHGSISRRQSALARTIHKPVRALPIDRAVRRTKLLSLVALLAAIGFAWLDARAATEQPQATQVVLVAE